MTRALASVLAPLLAVAACAGARPPATKPPAPAAAAPRDVHDAVVTALPGTWHGKADTPFGPMPMAMTFVREPDASIHARLEQGPDNYLDFRFTRGADGRWSLAEAGALPGLGVQSQVLAPADARGDTARWTAPEPGYLDVELAIDGDALRFDAILRGKPHASFRLERVSSR